MSWRNADQDRRIKSSRRIVDDARGIEFERTGAALKGTATLFKLALHDEKFEVTADGPYRLAATGPEVWMGLRVDARPRGRALQACDERLVRTAIEALLAFGRDGDGWMNAETDYQLLSFDNRMYRLDQDGTMRTRRATFRERRAYGRQRGLALP